MDSKSVFSEKDEDTDSIPDHDRTNIIYEHAVSSTSKPPKFVFMIDCLDGYSLRQLMEIIKLSLTSCPLFLSKEGIIIQRGNGVKTVILSAELFHHNFACYHLDPELVNYPGDESSEYYHIICPNIIKLREAIRSVARKEGIRIYQYEGDPFIYIQVYGGTKNAEGCGAVVPLEPYEPIDYVLDEYRQPFTEPNCKIPLAEFCGFCSVIAKYRGVHYVEFRTYLKGVWIMSMDSSHRVLSDKKWGDCDDSHRVPIVIPGGPRIIFHGPSLTDEASSYYSIKVPLETIKALAKMTNLVVNGLLRIFAEHNKLLRLQTHINYYGPLTFYLRESE